MKKTRSVEKPIRPLTDAQLGAASGGEFAQTKPPKAYAGKDPQGAA